MKHKIMEQLRNEVIVYRKYLIAEEFTVSQIMEEAYAIAVKQFIVEAMEHLTECNSTPEAVWKWLDKQDNILDYLYALWLDCDYSFIPGLADVLYNELQHEMEVHLNE